MSRDRISIRTLLVTLLRLRGHAGARYWLASSGGGSGRTMPGLPKRTGRRVYNRKVTEPQHDKPQPVAPLRLETDDDRRRSEDAHQRRDERLARKRARVGDGIAPRETS